MSRGFVKKMIRKFIVPPRADLPEGVVNYVTQGGMGRTLNENKN
jgi:transcription elongation factor GreB